MNFWVTHIDMLYEFIIWGITVTLGDQEYFEKWLKSYAQLVTRDQPMGLKRENSIFTWVGRNQMEMTGLLVFMKLWSVFSQNL